jgi:FkbM family methyltransferase
LGTVKFVKMDVEGAEVKVIAGGAALFEDASPIVLFEVRRASPPPS